MSDTEKDPLLECITTLLPALLNTMQAFDQVQRALHPPRYQKLAEFLQPYSERLTDANRQLQQVQFPAHAEPFYQQLQEATTHTLRACENFAAASNGQAGLGQVMRAMRCHCRAQEMLYPLAPMMTPLSQYFLEMPFRNNNDLIASLAAEGSKGGIMHADNDRKSRGGFSLYVPEHADDDKPLALVVALHGGSGHGADFLWSWLREARGRGFILMAPTSQQGTWSLMGSDHDSKPIRSMLDYVQQNWSVDAEHILLTGLSDGATFALLCGLQQDSPFTHLAALSGVLHPENFINGNISRASGKPVYLVHGSLDWMFPIESAYMARDELTKAGADLVFREIGDLSHNYARAENDPILTWFNPLLSLPQD
jgi:phospholipase/carboxylesterase|tara:strand:- start:77 stop:1180 length:1104 start_codon:yes stop_codon:yes gene_type:complete